MNILKTIRSIDIDAVDVDEEIAALTVGQLVLQNYAKLDLTPPDWLQEKLIDLKRDVTVKAEAILQKRIREQKARLEVFKTRDEKRADAAKELAELEQKLAERRAKPVTDDLL